MDPMMAMIRPTTKEDELQALADTLRKRKRAADFFSISTIKPLQQMAQNRGEEIQATAERQGVLREALAQREADKAEQEANRAAKSEEARIRAEAQAAYRSEQLGLQRESNDIARFRAENPRSTSTDRLTNIDRYIDDEGNPYMIGYRNGVPHTLKDQMPVPPEVFEKLERQTEMTETALANGLNKFQEKADKTLPLVSSVHALDNLLEEYDKAGATVDDVPGMSYAEKWPGGLGNAVRAMKDIGAEGAPSGDIFSAIQAIQNTIGVERAGLAQTVTEIERIMKETGKDALSNPQVFMEFYGRLKTAMKRDLDNLKAGTSKRVLNEYRKNMGEGGFDITNTKFKDIKLDGVKKDENQPSQTSGGLTEEEQREKADLEAYLNGANS